MKIGFIGTGTMGQPMLANLVKKGFQAIAYDTAPAALSAAWLPGGFASTCRRSIQAPRGGSRPG